jgi:hypothetical protein
MAIVVMLGAMHPAPEFRNEPPPRVVAPEQALVRRPEP